MIKQTVNGKEEKLYTVTEVAFYIGVVVPTINRWYLYKKENPDSEWAQYIPDYVTLSDNQKAPRYWRESDIYRLIEFHQKFPKGRGGVMGSVTQRYQPKQRRKKDGKKKSGRISKAE